MQLRHRATKEDLNILKKEGEWLNTTVIDNLLFYLYREYSDKRQEYLLQTKEPKMENHVVLMAQDSRILFSKYKSTGKVLMSTFNKYFLNIDQTPSKISYHLPFNLDGLLDDQMELKHWFLIKIDVCLLHSTLSINIYDSMNNEEYGILNTLCGWLQNLCLQILKSNELGSIYRKNSLVIRYHPMDIQKDGYSCADFMILFILYYIGGLGIEATTNHPLESPENKQPLSECVIRCNFRGKLFLFLKEKM